MCHFISLWHIHAYICKLHFIWKMHLMKVVDGWLYTQASHAPWSSRIFDVHTHMCRRQSRKVALCNCRYSWQIYGLTNFAQLSILVHETYFIMCVFHEAIFWRTTVLGSLYSIRSQKRKWIQIRTCMYDALAVQCFWMCLKFYITDADISIVL